MASRRQGNDVGSTITVQHKARNAITLTNNQFAENCFITVIDGYWLLYGWIGCWMRWELAENWLSERIIYLWYVRYAAMRFTCRHQSEFGSWNWVWVLLLFIIILCYAFSVFLHFVLMVMIMFSTMNECCLLYALTLVMML